MVHALHEAWRVLHPQGTMVDLRPLNAHAPLEIVFSGGSELAGPVDMSPDIEDEIAADQAVEAVVKEGIFKETKMDFFDLALYWNTVTDMLADFDERWQGEIILRAGIIRRARALFKQHPSPVQVRLRVRMKLGLFDRAS